VTVRPGHDWGIAATPPPSAGRAAGDAALAAALGSDPQRAVVLCGGDLHRTLGLPGATAAGLRVPIDLMEVDADGATFRAVAHVIARRPGRFGWWRGPVVAVMNAEFVGDWDVAPRAHPNDGKLDMVRVDPSMPLRQRWQAFRRLRTGGHLPHPSIAVSRGAEHTVDLDRPLALYVDGVERARVRSFTARVIPDAAEIFV